MVLLALAAGSLLGMPVASRALRRVGLPDLVRCATLVFATIGVALARSASFAGLVAAAAAFGFVNGGFGVVINAVAARWERRTGKRCVASCHASFSFATLAASIGGGLVVPHLTPGLHLTLVGAVCVLGALVVSGCLGVLGASGPDDERGDGERGHESGGGEGVAARRIVRLAAALAFVALFSEGVVTDWSAFFLQHAVMGHPGAQQSWGYAGFALAMACGRLGGDAVLLRVGERRVLAMSVTLAVCGYVVVVSAVAVAVAVAGFVLVGLGLSNLYPAMISLVGARMPERTRDTAITAVSGIGYFGFLGGPAVLGFASPFLGLRAAMAAPVVALLVGGVVLRSLRRAAR